MTKFEYRGAMTTLEKVKEGGFSTYIYIIATGEIVDDSWYEGCLKLVEAIEGAKITIDDYWSENIHT